MKAASKPVAVPKPRAVVQKFPPNLAMPAVDPCPVMWPYFRFLNFTVVRALKVSPKTERDVAELFDDAHEIRCVTVSRHCHWFLLCVCTRISVFCAAVPVSCRCDRLMWSSNNATMEMAMEVARERTRGAMTMKRKAKTAMAKTMAKTVRRMQGTCT